MVHHKATRVVIADDHPALRVGIRHILEKSDGIIVVGEACNGQEAVQMVEQLNPDVLLLDIQMPVMDGLEVLDTLKTRQANVLVLVLSAYNDEYFIKETLAKGAWGYYLKEDAPIHIIQAIKNAVASDGKMQQVR